MYMYIYIFKLFLILSFGIGGICQEIIVHPQNATVKLGDNVTLQCQFNQAIEECVWVQNNIPVKIDLRYQYSDSNANGRHTSNCSILITSFNTIDASNWQCYCSQGTGCRPGHKSIKAFLKIATEVSVHPKNASVNLGDDVKLLCKYKNSNTSCVWFRNGTAIKISDRYRYINSEGHGNNKNDCSIKITKFHLIDATGWQCSCTLNSEISNDKCMSNIAYLTLRSWIPSADLPATTITTLAQTTLTTENDSDWNAIQLLLYVGIGVLLAIVILLVVIYHLVINKAKKKARKDLAIAISTPPNNQLQESSYANILQSSDSMNIKDHQDKTEPFQFEDELSQKMYTNWSAQPHDNDLPSYCEDKLSHDDQAVGEEIFMSLDEIKVKYPSIKCKKVSNANLSVINNHTHAQNDENY